MHDGHVDPIISGTIRAKNGASRPFLQKAKSWANAHLSSGRNEGRKLEGDLPHARFKWDLGGSPSGRAHLTRLEHAERQLSCPLGERPESGGSLELPSSDDANGVGAPGTRPVLGDESNGGV